MLRFAASLEEINEADSDSETLMIESEELLESLIEASIVRFKVPYNSNQKVCSFLLVSLEEQFRSQLEQLRLTVNECC